MSAAPPESRRPVGASVRTANPGIVNVPHRHSDGRKINAERDAAKVAAA